MKRNNSVTLFESNKLPQNTYSEVLIYTTPNEKVKVEILLQNENLWLTQARIAELFGVDRSVVTKHLKNVFESGELKEEVVCAFFALTTQHGAIPEKTQVRDVKFYSLDAIISVGYRINSSQATLFRIWATERLKEYIIKGFTMDDERLKSPHQLFGKDYFEEQLERIRDIRSSERRFYQKITDIYAQCSADYTLDSDVTKRFFAKVQNKLHFAISGKTAAEIVYLRANCEKENMGLTTWKNAPKGNIRKTDVSIAKNYLEKPELDHLNRIVSMYLDYAELQAKKNLIMYQRDWIDKLNAFLQFNEEEILNDNGNISHEVAKELAEKEFAKFNIIQNQNYISDFDNMIKQLK